MERNNEIMKKLNHDYSYLFACPILSTSLNLNHKKITRHILELKAKDKTKGSQLSNVGGWQSKPLPVGGDLDGPLKPLVENIVQNGVSYLKEQQFNTKRNFRLTNMWANVNGYKDSNSRHSHPMAILSGCYYAQVPDGAGEIEFFHPSPVIENHWLPEDKYYQELIPSNSVTWTFPVKENTIYIFPAWLDHSVKPTFNKKISRVSVSFNISSFKYTWNI